MIFAVLASGTATLQFLNPKMKTITQGRRRFLKSSTAIERHRRSARAEGSRGGGEHNIPPLLRGVWGISIEKFFEFNMSVEAILMHFETIFACKIQLIV